MEALRAPTKGGNCLSLETGSNATPSRTQNGPRTSCSSGTTDQAGGIVGFMDALVSSAATLPNGMGLLYGGVDPKARRA